MIERFDGLDLFEGLADVERLEEGIYLERIRAAEIEEDDREDIRMICGAADPDGRWLSGSIREIRETGVMDPEGTISWHGLGAFFRDRGLLMEEGMEVSLEELTEILEEDDRVLCMLSDCVLECPDAGRVPGISANMIASVEKIDLSDPGRETVTIGRMCEENEGVDLETYPLPYFLRAWDAGERRMLVLQGGGDETWT